MRYERIVEGRFISRPNRFIAQVEIDGAEETVHVKNTGRCKELLLPGSKVYLQESDNPQRKTRWDLIAVEKGQKLINMDSQIPNHLVKEWIEAGNLLQDLSYLRSEYTYGKSRIDLYAEYDGGKKALIEVKGVTLEEDGIVKFPDAPSERAVKHVEELIGALEDGYEAFIVFVIQMAHTRYFTPNRETQEAFAEALVKAKEAGVHIIACECQVTPEELHITSQVKVRLQEDELEDIVDPIVEWYRKNKRDLPWRHHVNAYRVWVSEIMLQQTRVEAVKRYFARFMERLPDIKALADAEEDELLKLWEGLGYYNRVRNMQKAARQIIQDYQGEFPDQYDQILGLTGIGSYTAGAISSFAFSIPKPAVDGNVLRVISRITGSYEDIMKASVKKKMEAAIEQIIPKESPSDFNQGLIELGAIVCVPNGAPRCEECPVASYCKARKYQIQEELPVKKKAKERKIQKKTVFVFQDGEKVAIQKRPSKGLLAGLYQFPNLDGTLSMDEAVAYCKKIGLVPVYIKPIVETKHIFSHVEWHMNGYAVKVDELEKDCKENMIFAEKEEIQKTYSIPSAFEAFIQYMNIERG